jgi:hypothetical protein
VAFLSGHGELKGKGWVEEPMWSSGVLAGAGEQRRGELGLFAESSGREEKGTFNLTDSW